MAELTYGQKAVGLTANPSDSPQVLATKQEFANVIDTMNTLRTESDSPEAKRLASVAITQIQLAQMCATKAQTWKD